MVFQKTLDFRTRGRGTTDITDAVQGAVAASGIRTGVCTVFLQHTSASLILCENADPDVRRDLETIIARLAPDADPAYRHDAEGDDDMAAHARTMLTSNSLTIPVTNGALALGTWQGLYLWEHRTAPHPRSVVVTVMGEP
ncbi:MAG: secondary thiamine-phosphate synthase enzyme YjbQ [Burkholderiales bacterium]